MQAEDGVGLPEEILDGSDFESSAKLYFVYTRFDFLWTLNYFALIVISFIEVILFSSLISYLLFSYITFKELGSRDQLLSI